MSISANLWKALVLTVVIGVVLSSDSRPLAQAGRQGATPPSVLPTGGGKALLDISDTVFLLLDHQAGLFQTVKDIDVAELRRNTVMLARLANAVEKPSHHHGVGAWWPERTAHAGDSRVRAPRGLERVKSTPSRTHPAGPSSSVSAPLSHPDVVSGLHECMPSRSRGVHVIGARRDVGGRSV
jgi:hypothetical protein